MTPCRLASPLPRCARLVSFLRPRKPCRLSAFGFPPSASPSPRGGNTPRPKGSASSKVRAFNNPQNVKLLHMQLAQGTNMPLALFDYVSLSCTRVKGFRKWASPTLDTA